MARRIARSVEGVLFGSHSLKGKAGKLRGRGVFSDGTESVKEHVVHTTILKQSTTTGNDLTFAGGGNLLQQRIMGSVMGSQSFNSVIVVEKIIIVTTLRIIVTQLTRRPNNSFVKCLWQGKLKYLRR